MSYAAPGIEPQDATARDIDEAGAGIVTGPVRDIVALAIAAA